VTTKGGMGLEYSRGGGVVAAAVTATTIDGSSIEVDHSEGGTITHAIKDVCRDLQTGDVVFFSGISWTSYVTRVFTRSEWSHVAIVEYDRTKTEFKFLWESVYHSEPDIIDVYTNSPVKRGVRLVEAWNRIDSYGRHEKQQFFRIAVLKFSMDLQLVSEEDRAYLQAEIHNRLSQFQNREHPKNFESSPLNLVRAELSDIVGEAQGPVREYFCSQLVVATLQSMGVMDRTIEARSVTPAMLAQYPGRFPMRQGFRLGPELHIYKVSLDPPLVPLL
jgi:hypothetical protein